MKTQTMTTLFDLLADPITRETPMLDSIEMTFKNLAKFQIANWLPERAGRYNNLISNTRQETIREIARHELQDAAELETSTDPLRLDGQFVYTPDIFPDDPIDNRNYRKQDETTENRTPHEKFVSGF